MTIFNMRKYPAMHCTGPLKQPIEFCPFVMQHRFMCQMCREVGHWSVMRVPQKTLRFHFESFPNIHNCWLKACVGQTCVTVRQGPIWWQRVNYKRSTRGRGGDMWHMFHLVAFHCQPSSNIGASQTFIALPPLIQQRSQIFSCQGFRWNWWWRQQCIQTNIWWLA